MKPYVDGYLIPIAKSKLPEYEKMASKWGEMWMKHGALAYYECAGDDLTPNMYGQEMAQFPNIAGAREDETVVFAFIVYESREHRDRVNAAVMADPAMWEQSDEMPFDMTRAAYGGFSAFVHQGIATD